MKSAGKYRIVMVTAPDMRVARKLARAALMARLIACANVLPKIESHYVWQGKVEKASEILVVMKTSRARLRELERLVMANHPYDTPEFLVLPIQAGSARYLGWLGESVR